MSENRTFTINGVEYPIKRPRGRNGVKATNYVVSRMQSSSEAEVMASVSDMIDDDHFWRRHLPILLGVDSDLLENEIDYAELLSATLTAVTVIMEGFAVPEVSAAMGNSAGTPEEVAAEA